MQQAIQTLWKLLRPGGRLAITTWGPRFFEPVNTAFWEAMRTSGPTFTKGSIPGIGFRSQSHCALCCCRLARRRLTLSRKTGGIACAGPKTGGRWLSEPAIAARSNSSMRRSGRAYESTASNMSVPMVWNQSRLTCCMDWQRRAKRSCFTGRLMSALGQKRTFALQNVMSALPPRADIGRRK